MKTCIIDRKEAHDLARRGKIRAVGIGAPDHGVLRIDRGHDYSDPGERISIVGVRVVDAADVDPGDRVLVDFGEMFYVYDA